MGSRIEVSIICKKDDIIITYTCDKIDEYEFALPKAIATGDVIIMYEEIPVKTSKYNLYRIVHWNKDNPNRGLRKEI